MEKDKRMKVIVIKKINEIAFFAGADIEEFKKERWGEAQSKYYDQFIASVGDSLEYCSKPVLALMGS